MVDAQYWTKEGAVDARAAECRTSCNRLLANLEVKRRNMKRRVYMRARYIPSHARMCVSALKTRPGQ
jgi:hypothetical protein